MASCTRVHLNYTDIVIVANVYLYTIAVIVIIMEKEKLNHNNLLMIELSSCDWLRIIIIIRTRSSFFQEKMSDTVYIKEK